MKNIKLLAIAPYNGLKDLILEEAKARNNLDVEVHVADMLEGVELVKTLQNKDFDCIISRAGTAELIREVTDIPVIDIKISIIDMISAIKLAENYSGSYAVVGFRSITEKAEIVRELNDYSIDIQTINSLLEIEGYLTDLKMKGVSLIVGDVITSSKARELGLNTILVTSGKESVKNAFDEVVNLLKLLVIFDQKNILIKKIMDYSDMEYIAFNKERKVVLTNIKTKRQYFTDFAKEIVDQLFKEKECEIIKEMDNSLTLIRGKLFESNEEVYACFYFRAIKPSTKLADPAITFLNVFDESKTNLETIPTNNKQLLKVIKDVKSYSNATNPLLLIGEIGTGKDFLAHAIYKNGPYQKSPLIVIDAKYMDEKKWLNLINKDNSFLTESNITIYMKNLQMLNEACQQLLESYFINTYIHKRNRFIFSFVNGYSDVFDKGPFLQFIRNELGAFPLVMPTLNDRKEDISSLTSLFMSELILKYGKQVIGLEPKALQLLQEFKWTNHIDQLKRIIEECIILTDTYFISEESVQSVLANERFPTANTTTYLDLQKPLDEINKDIINLVLSEEGFNQSKAAERLGISRSTLWRKLK
ncbi:PrpR N-terminal domain-containing protein [Ornithinibacillus bavariensis]|uniref:sigma-54-dependent Fis family transcriptional regulator n=1 Tax=Ornithinibacillus bavariensis TaxID=545502 RepID=UPI000ECE2B78|nr:hypothetical protein [Ornithinibacillus sp.]